MPLLGCRRTGVPAFRLSGLPASLLPGLPACLRARLACVLASRLACFPASLLPGVPASRRAGLPASRLACFAGFPASTTWAPRARRPVDASRFSAPAPSMLSANRDQPCCGTHAGCPERADARRYPCQAVRRGQHSRSPLQPRRAERPRAQAMSCSAVFPSAPRRTVRSAADGWSPPSECWPSVAASPPEGRVKRREHLYHFRVAHRTISPQFVRVSARRRSASRIAASRSCSTS
jgi:hypothetical protein